MLRRLWLSLRRDTLVNWRNHYYTVVVALAILYFLAIRFLVPTDLTIQHETFVADLTADGRVAAAMAQLDSDGRVSLFPSADAVTARMAERPHSVGVLVEEGQPLPRVTLFFQGREGERLQNLMAVSVEELLRSVYEQPYPQPVALEREVLRGHGLEVRQPFNLWLIPIFVLSEAAMVGMLFVAALIFMEKEEGTLYAQLVTPARRFEYLLSKALSLGLLGALFTLMFVPPLLGAGPNYLHLLGVVVLGAIFSSLAGAALAVQFENLTGFLFPVLLLLLLLSMPVASYLVPSFAPAWVRLMPTYPMIFGMREALFPTGSPQVVLNAMLYLLAASLVALPVATWSLGRHLARS